MIKKLSRCMVVVALALLATSYVKADPLPNPFSETCGSLSAPTGTNPTISGPLDTITCAAFTVPSGDTLTSVEMLIENSFSQGIPGQTNSVQFTYLGTGFDAVGGGYCIGCPGPGLTTTSTSGPSMVSDGAATDAGAVTGETPGSTCTETSGATVACFEETPVTTSFSMTVSSSWIKGGTTASGADGVTIWALFAYAPTVVPPAPSPEPSSLTLLGSGLLGLMAMAWRHKRLA